MILGRLGLGDVAWTLISPKHRPVIRSFIQGSAKNKAAWLPPAFQPLQSVQISTLAKSGCEQVKLLRHLFRTPDYLLRAANIVMREPLVPAFDQSSWQHDFERGPAP